MRKRLLHVRGVFRVASTLAFLAALASGGGALADCALIPAAIKALPSDDGAIDRPFAAPGDTVTIFSDSGCKSSPDKPHFDTDPANSEITITFTPPLGAPSTVVPSFSASAVLDCGDDRCFAIEFQIPETTALTAGPYPLTGPVSFEVRNTAVVGNPVVASIDDLFEPAKGCNLSNRVPNLFQKFSVLPARNKYCPVGYTSALCPAPTTSLNATVDGSGALLIPFDYSEVLADSTGSASGTVRILSITADLPNGLNGGNGLAGVDADFIRPSRSGRFVRSFSLNGRPIPPLLKVAASVPLTVNGTYEYGDTIVGSVDFIDSVLRIAQVGKDPDPINPLVPLRIFALAGDPTELGATGGLALQGGIGPIVLSGINVEAGAAAPLNSVTGSKNLAVVARSEALEQQFGSGNQNGDGDFDDKVAFFVDLATNTEVSTNMAIVETARSPRKAVLTSAGSHVALMQSEIYEDRTDFNGDGDVQDGLFRLWTADGNDPFCVASFGGNPCELTSGRSQLPVSVSTLLRAPSGPNHLVFSGAADPSRYVFFGVPESGSLEVDTFKYSFRESGGAETAQASFDPVVSSSGQYIVYTSLDSQIVTGVGGGTAQIYQTDTLSGFNVLVSSPSYGSTVGGDQDSGRADISQNGEVVGFESAATNLVAGDIEGQQDVFAYVSLLGGLIRLSQSAGGAGGDGPSSNVAVSDSVAYGAFESQATNLVAGDTNGVTDIFRAGYPVAPELVSVPSAGGVADGESNEPDLSADGNLVAFHSAATNLLDTPDPNGALEDVFLRDMSTGLIEKISVGYAGAVPNGPSINPQMDRSGRYIVYSSQATNLIAPGTALTGNFQCYLYDRVRNTTEIVSITLAGEPANADCLEPNVDLTGTFITYASSATNLDTLAPDAVQRIYFFNRINGVVVLASGDATLDTPVSGPTGLRSSVGAILLGIVVFEASTGDLGPTDTNGVSDIYADIFLMGTSLNLDADTRDTVLHVFDSDPSVRDFTNTEIPMYSTDGLGDVAVAAGRAIIAPSNGSGSPQPAVIWDQEAQVGGVLRPLTGASAFGALRVAISETAVCVSDAAGLLIGDPATGVMSATGIATPLGLTALVSAVGHRCVAIDDSGDLRIVERAAPLLFENLGPATDFQVAEQGVAFRTCEAAAGMDLNGDTDLVDCVMNFYDFGTQVVTETEHVAIPCVFPGCDPFFEPYRVGPGFVSFVTSEVQEQDFGGSNAVGITCLPTSPAGVCDKTGDEDGNDVAIEIYSLASGRAQVFPVSELNPPQVAPFPKVVPGAEDNLMVIQLPAEILGEDFDSLPPDQLVTVIVGDPEGDGVFEADGNTDPLTTVVDKCQEIADPDQIDADGDGMAQDCDLAFSGAVLLPNDDPAMPVPGAEAQLPGQDLCDLDRSGTIIRPEVDQIWADRGASITPPVDQTIPPDGTPDPTDDRDPDADGEITAVDFRLCLNACAAQPAKPGQAAGCPEAEGGSGDFGYGTGGMGCGLLGIEAVLALLPWAMLRLRRKRR